MKCPNCSLVNPPDSQVCDCGYGIEDGSYIDPIPGADARRGVTATDIQIAARMIDNVIAFGGGVVIAALLSRIHLALAALGIAFMFFYKMVSSFVREQGIGWWLANKVAKIDRRYRLKIRN